MSSRLTDVLSEARRAKKKLFCGFLTLGFPNLKTTRQAMLALEQAGTDIIELGFPFSDPLADGPTIQMASERALKQGVRVEHACRLVSALRKNGFKTPVLFFSYLNPVLRFGAQKIAQRLRSAGFDGIIIPDLTYDEGRDWEILFTKHGLSLVYLVAPTTEKARMRQIARHSGGFVYYVSLRGVTGTRTSLAKDLAGNLRVLRRLTPKPVLVGFGVSQTDQARTIGRLADGVIVGSALVKLLQKKGNCAGRIKTFASQMIRAMR